MSEQKVEAMKKAFDTLKLIGAGTREVVETVEAIFHIEDFYELAKRNSFIGLNFYQMMCNINAVIISPFPVSIPGDTISGGLLGGIEDILIGGGSIAYKPTIRGKLMAISACFRAQAKKMDDLIDVNIIASFMQGTGAAQIAQDAINNFSQGGIMLAKEAVKAGAIA